MPKLRPHVFFLSLSLCLLLSGCFNDAHNLQLGSVSIGQQLIDLKKALDTDSISKDEYLQAKADLLSLLGGAEFDGSDDDDDDDDEHDEDDDHKRSGKARAEDDKKDKDSGFLF